MGKRGTGVKKANRKPKRQTRNEYVDAEDMDDEVDAFHKQRDKILLDVNEDSGESDEENEHPVFDFEDINEDDEEDDIEEDRKVTKLAAKIKKQQKYLRAKEGGVEDEMHDKEEDNEEKRAAWGRRKKDYYDGDEINSSDEELPAEEEAEVKRLQREKAMLLSMEDYGLGDDSDAEPTFEQILVKGKSTTKSSSVINTEDDEVADFEEIKKDLNSLSKKEQMDVVYSSAPELVGLLSELNDALDQLENKVEPLLRKVRKENESVKGGGMHYLKVKQGLLLSYCQAITFYLLLKSEGQPVRDHPVIARLVEIKSLLDRTNQLDEQFALEFDEILKIEDDNVEMRLTNKTTSLTSDSFTKTRQSGVSVSSQGTIMLTPTEEVMNVDAPKVHGNGGEKRKQKADKIDEQSKKMLKIRADLEEKLKSKVLFSSNSLKPDKAQKKHGLSVNSQLETRDDFDDETTAHGLNNGHTKATLTKVSQLITTAKAKKSKIASGDDDLPQRDDIGERRRKHELQVQANAGINSDEDEADELKGGDEDSEMEEDNDGTEDESENDFYEQVKKQRAEKLAAKTELYSRNLAAPPTSEIESLVDGKRQITREMEKNRGLTRHRKKLTKNPRKKYKLAHKKAVVNRKGQVRDVKKPTGPYGGEISGINAGISRSIRFKS